MDIRMKGTSNDGIAPREGVQNIIFRIHSTTVYTNAFKWAGS